MFIQTEPTPNPATLKFLPGRPVMEKGTANFTDAEKARRSPLATALFGLDGISGVFLDSDFITVTKSDDKNWEIMKPHILSAIMDHFQSGKPAVEEPEAEAASPVEKGDEDTIGSRIKELIETRIRPAATQDGGDVTYHSFKDGVVYLEFQGSAFGLLTGIENMLRNYVPEVEAVKDHRDALPKPGLETPEGKAIWAVLEEQINPSVASHGGHISLVDVQGDTAYIRLEGGCQGCGMADVTLKQGVATAIQRVAPDITNVLDVTDHAGGNNPYYQPGKGGISPV
ncbi:MAG: NifU family protein [Proteobacteria bacterium]|nr:NifU family protein [Pseudomonadota bacterium]